MRLEYTHTLPAGETQFFVKKMRVADWPVISPDDDDVH